MVGWNFPNSEICVRVARYEFSKNHPTFPTKHSNSLYISQLYGRFLVVFLSQKIYLSYFFFQNRLFFVKKFFLGQTDPVLVGILDPPQPPFAGVRYDKRTFSAIFEFFQIQSLAWFLQASVFFIFVTIFVYTCPFYYVMQNFTFIFAKKD